MGERGPVPKRSTQRRRQNKTEAVASAVSDGTTIYGPELQGEHTPMAVRFWAALRTSGQAQFYEPSDWAVAEMLVVAIDAFVSRPSAMMLASLNTAMGSLLVTEGDRRRARLELERAPAAPPENEDEAEVATLDDYRRRISG